MAYEETRMKRKTNNIYQSDLFQDDGIHLKPLRSSGSGETEPSARVEQLIRPFDFVHLRWEG